ncbi:MAG: hypothetical protein Q9224_001068 [Gallowayella concinna]
MKERTASVPLAQAGAPNMQRTTEMVHIPHANLPYPPPAALSQPTRNDGIFLNTTLHTIHQARYSPERNHISAAPTASAGRRPSSNNAGHDERHDKSGPSSRRSSRQQHHHISSTNHSPYDPEKAAHARHSPTHAHRPAHIQSTYIAEEEEEERNEHTVWILVSQQAFCWASPASSTVNHPSTPSSPPFSSSSAPPSPFSSGPENLSNPNSTPFSHHPSITSSASFPPHTSPISTFSKRIKSPSPITAITTATPTTPSSSHL